MIGGDRFKGIGGDCAYTFIIHQNIRNLEALRGLDGIGLVLTLLHLGFSRGLDGTAFTGIGGDRKFVYRSGAASAFQMHIIQRDSPAIFAIGPLIAESKLNTLDTICIRNLNLRIYKFVILLEARQIISGIPNSVPSEATVCRSLQG